MPHEPLADTLTRVLIAIALNQPVKADRDHMLGVMRKDGWLPAADEREAA